MYQPMYQHLLVPIDDSDLSIALVGQAVSLARQLGARLSFFHALPDGAAEIPRSAVGPVRELLAKAEAAARALGLPCASLWLRDADAVGAIVRAAAGQGCDLIVVATQQHAGSGMVLGPQQLEALLRCGRPVLVAADGELTPPARAIAVIRDEHRALAAVLHAWQDHLQACADAGRAADPAAMRPALDFLEMCSEQHHHPKESGQLFRLLRLRCPALAAELDELDRQHQRDGELLAGLRRLLDAGDTGLARQLQLYADFMWEHLGREEGVVLPAAQRYLLAPDWLELDRVFIGERADPGAGAAARRALEALAAPRPV
jgi:nucleotide-binding universal stress UspA family protein/hemerythrin-like domain-containing protein